MELVLGKIHCNVKLSVHLSNCRWILKVDAPKGLWKTKTFCILYGNAETSYFILPSLNGALRAVKRKRGNTASTVKCIEKLHRLCRFHRNVGDCASVGYEHLGIFSQLFTLLGFIHRNKCGKMSSETSRWKNNDTKKNLFYNGINIENYPIVKTFELFIENLNIH